MGWVRMAKLVALIGFFLPWVTVSCAGHMAMEASGWTLATGHYRVIDADTGQLHRVAEQGSGALVIALLLMGFGFAITLVRDRRIPVVAAAAALTALALCWYGTRDLRPESIAQEVQRRGVVAQTIAGQLRIDWHAGWWLTNGGLVAAAALAGLAASGRALRVARR